MVNKNRNYHKIESVWFQLDISLKVVEYMDFNHTWCIKFYLLLTQ